MAGIIIEFTISFAGIISFPYKYAVIMNMRFFSGTTYIRCEPDPKADMR